MSWYNRVRLEWVGKKSFYRDNAEGTRYTPTRKEAGKLSRRISRLHSTNVGLSRANFPESGLDHPFAPTNIEESQVNGNHF